MSSAQVLELYFLGFTAHASGEVAIAAVVVIAIAFFASRMRSGGG